MKIGLFAAVILIGGFGVLIYKTPKATTLGEFATRLEERESEQKHNAILSAKKIDGKIVQPGESFSFNETVGSWSRDRGYRRAPVSYGGQLIPMWGGGVCQTSTTLYNAALMAGMKIEERWPHHFAPSYVSPGRDAAVAYPNIDLKFVNTRDHPVTIHCSIRQESLAISITGLGDQPNVSITQRRLAAFAPQVVTLGKGEKEHVANPGKPGYEVLTFLVTPAGKKLLSHDTYPVMHRVIQKSHN